MIIPFRFRISRGQYICHTLYHHGNNTLMVLFGQYPCYSCIAYFYVHIKLYIWVIYVILSMDNSRVTHSHNFLTNFDNCSHTIQKHKWPKIEILFFSEGIFIFYALFLLSYVPKPAAVLAACLIFTVALAAANRLHSFLFPAVALAAADRLQTCISGTSLTRPAYAYGL